MALPHFEDEEQFLAWYLQRPTPPEQVACLSEWRTWQSKQVGSLGPIIGHLAGDQYTQVDHFLLELLQNADDNTYPNGVAPSLTITLESGRCVFACNEVGFSADNVFAICYAAASTKKREPGKRSFIGEKGIGFKSLFAVAEVVEIHSGAYHFELRDKEFIIPRPLKGDTEAGSRIVVRFKPSMAGIAALLSERLALLSKSADQFVLFLQKLEKFTVNDQLTGETTSVEIIREGTRCVVQHDSVIRTYRMVTDTVEFPEEVVLDRFDHLSGTLARDVCFAVPIPQELDPKEDPVGQLFCFLPTRVVSGFPFHIQLDGKTTTNRENIESGAKSKWNRHLWANLPQLVLRLFLTLRDDPEFADHLPRYLPTFPITKTGNDELNAAIVDISLQLGKHPIGKDRKGTFRPISTLRCAPPAMVRWVETDQFAPHLGPGGEFLAPSWRNHATRLLPYGCVSLKPEDVAELFVKGGTPVGLGDTPEEESARAFLDSWIEMRASVPWTWAKIKAAPVYPTKSGVVRRWSGVTNTTMLVSSDGREVSVPEGTVTIDPIFTYSPGGSAEDRVRDFNEKFRTYLINNLEVKRFSDATYLHDVLIPGLKRESEKPIASREDLHRHTELWLELYYRVWWREKTIINDSSEERFSEMLRAIGNCSISITTHGVSGWAAKPLRTVSLPPTWWTNVILGKAFEEAGAPMVSLALSEVHSAYVRQRQIKDSRLDESEWKKFLSRCGAVEGSRVLDVRLPEYGVLPPAAEDLRKSCNAVFSNYREKEIVTPDFDGATVKLLGAKPPLEELTVEIARWWPVFKDRPTLISWTYYSQKGASIPVCLARCRVVDGLVVLSDQGVVSPRTAMLDTPDNRAVGAGLIPLVSAARYAGDAFLLFLGVGGQINEPWLEELARAAVQDPDGENFLSRSSVVMRLASRLAKHRPEGRNWVRTARVFAHGQTRELLRYDDWVEQKGDKGFPASVADEVLEAMEELRESNVEAVINDLFKLGDLAGKNSKILDWLRRLDSSHTHRNEISLKFAASLRDQGLVFGGREARTAEQLPLVWDRFPNPCAATGFLVLSTNSVDRRAELNACQLLGWPCASSKTATCKLVNGAKIDSLAATQLRLTAQDLNEKFSDAQGTRPSASDAMRCACDGTLLVFSATGIHVEIEGYPESPEIDYWFQTPALSFNAQKLTVAEALGRIVDAQASTTIAPFIETLFAQTLAAAKSTLTPAQPKSGSSEKPTPKSAQPTGGAPTEEDSPSTGGNGGASTPPQTDEAPSGPRRRLYSYVSPGDNGGRREERNNTPAKKQKDAVELAGEKRLQEFCRERNLPCKDVTDKNVGYDFEISSGSETFYVELKSSRDSWTNWENSLTPNEFRAAYEKRNNYVLCVAERALEPGGALLFIRDPWGQADGFLFDAPWKKIASDPDQLFSTLEDISGTPPPRPDEL